MQAGEACDPRAAVGGCLRRVQGLVRAGLFGAPASGRRHGSGGIGLHGCRVYTWGWGWQISDSRIGNRICNEDVGAACEEP